MLRPQLNRPRILSFGLAALALIVAGSSAACQRDTNASAQTATSAQAVQPKRADTRAVTVRVDGMICMVCAGSVKNALKAVHGVQSAEVNLEKHSATLEYENGKVSVDELTRVINELGYKAGVPAPAQSQ